MKSNQIRLLSLLSLGCFSHLFTPGRLDAHTAMAVNGSVSFTIRKSNIVVEYEIECGARTPIDVRAKIDVNGDGIISEEELSAFNEAARRKLAKAKSLCYILLDAKPVKLLAERAAFTLDTKTADGTVVLKLWLASKEPLSTGFHRLVLTSAFCPLDAELLSLPIAASTGHGHGSLVRIIKLIAAGEPGLRFSRVSEGHISDRGGEQSVRCLLNNVTKRVQIDFELTDAKSKHVSSAAPEQGKANRLSVNAVTGATPIASRSKVRVTEISTFDALHFDPKEREFGKISYKLSRRAWVRIRILLRSNEQVVLRTLLDWSEREAGKHVETWDGRDTAGHLIDKTRFPCFVAIDADSRIHRKHPWTICKDLHVGLSLEDSVAEGGNGQMGVEATLREDTRGYGEQLGYTVRAYVDFKLFHSAVYKERGWHGFHFTIDTTGLCSGEHLLTVVVDDGADHVGTTSQKFNVVE